MIQLSVRSEGIELSLTAFCFVNKAVGISDCSICQRQQHALVSKAGHLEDGHQQLVSSVLLPAKLVQAEAAQQLQVRAAIRELVLVLVHLGVLVRLDDSRVGERLWHIPVLTQACNIYMGRKQAVTLYSFNRGRTITT